MDGEGKERGGEGMEGKAKQEKALKISGDLSLVKGVEVKLEMNDLGR